MEWTYNMSQISSIIAYKKSNVEQYCQQGASIQAWSKALQQVHPMFSWIQKSIFPPQLLAIYGCVTKIC